MWSKEQLVTVCGLGSVTGLKGANCGHDYHPFTLGISERNWTDEWLEEQNAKEDIKREFKGKEYNAYEATQKQRQMETAMRAQRQKVRGLEAGGADKDDIVIAKAKYQGQLQEYKQFCKDMELTPQMGRVYIDGLGRVTSGKTVVNSTKDAIIKRDSVYRNKAENKIESMPKKQLQKIVKSFKRKGGVIQMNEATDAYLESKRAEAITYNARTILLRQRPGRAAVFEELIHATQYRKGKIDGSRKSILQAEIEAQQKLLKHQKAYKLTEQEIEQTKRALKQYEKELKKMSR